MLGYQNSATVLGGLFSLSSCVDGGGGVDSCRVLGIRELNRDYK